MNPVAIFVSACVLVQFTGTCSAQDAVPAEYPAVSPVESDPSLKPLFYEGCYSCQKSAYVYGAPPGGCNAFECVIYDLTSQAVCTEVLNQPPTSNALWKQGLNVNVDQTILGGRIAAYKLQWFNGQWSQWFVPGVNDIDVKLNGCGMRRWWSYFFDHTHTYIICK